ncbi:MAG: N-acetylmuramoyl-L-alanine amidase [Coriobacteriia bacterium]|nr:N-acetylmuramoyl-L-alanine amidase [Coriobacteriia bacterium]
MLKRALAVIAAFALLTQAACTPTEVSLADPAPLDTDVLTDTQMTPESLAVEQGDESETSLGEEESAEAEAEEEEEEKAEEPSEGEETSRSPVELNIITDFRSNFVHGDKDAAHQKYIMLHDTEGWSSPANTIDWWDSNGNLVAAHFIVGTDGAVYQCVPLDKIAHHAGYGDTGHNAYYGISEDGRDDMKGTVWVGSWASDYGMNAWSIGIEMVHVGGSGDYPQAQLDALDALIAYIDGYYGFQSTIIDHKAWRSGNSDTSPEFAGYLWNYQNYRHH